MKGILSLAACAATLGLSAGAFAQFGGSNTLDATPHQFNVRGGIILPIDNSLRDLNNTWIGLGLDYRFEKSLLKDGETYLSIDWIGQSSSGSGFNVFPVMLNQRFWGEGAPGARTYSFLGLGVVFFDSGPSTNVYAVRGGLGKELNEMVFVEGSITLSEKDGGGRVANNVGLYVGYRF